MPWLLGIAVDNTPLALIIWGIAAWFARKKISRRASFGWFLIIWTVVMLAAIAQEASINRDYRRASIASAYEANIKQATAQATFAANQPELESIIEKVESGGVVDKKIHDHFWSLIPRPLIASPQRREDMINSFRKGIVSGKYLWHCIIMTVRAHQIVKTQACDDTLNQLSPADYAKEEAMLRAAASGAPYTLPNGRTVIINEAIAGKAVSALQTASAKLNVLFDPVWHQQSDQDIVSQMQQASNRINQQLPRMGDKITRLDTTIAGPGKTWTYMYTIVSPNSTSLTQQDLDKYLGTKVRNGVCTEKSMKAFIDNGVKIRYVYRASDGTVIGSIVVNPSDCKRILVGVKSDVSNL